MPLLSMLFVNIVLKWSANVSAFSLLVLAHVLEFVFIGGLCMVVLVSFLVAFHRE